MGTEKRSDESCLVRVEMLREAASKQMILKFRDTDLSEQLGLVV